MKSKGDFIIDLLASKKISQKDRERILKLSAKEFEKNDVDYQKILSEINGLKKTYEIEQSKLTSKIESLFGEIIISRIENVSKSDYDVSLQKPGYIHDRAKANDMPSDSERIYHKPKEITKFLKNFEENTALKFSTHIWDKTDFLSSYSTYIKQLNEEKKLYGFNNLFKYNRPLYNILNYFLFKPNPGLINGIPRFGWNSDELNEIKIGWQFPNDILKKWSIENYENEKENKKFPLEMIVPSELKPSERIRGKEINSFEDVANIFKTEIQFRGEEDNFYKEISHRLTNKHNLTNSDGSIEKLKKLHFYTYTKGVVSAIDSIFRSFVKNNESFKDVSFDLKSHQESIEINITQLNSFPSKSLMIERPNSFFSGDSNAIINHLFSLCDYSITSKFNDSDNLEIVILHDDAFGTPNGNNLKRLDSKMKINNLKDQEIIGFSHKLKFYV